MKSNISNSYADSKVDMTKFRIGFGLMHMVTPSSSLSLQFVYDQDKQTNEQGSTARGRIYGLYTGLAVFLY